MMRFILPLLVAFVVAAGGASGIAVIQAKRAPPTTADSAAGVEQDSTADSSEAEVDDSTLTALGDSTPPTSEVEAPPPAVPAKAVSSIDSTARATVAAKVKATPPTLPSPTTERANSPAVAPAAGAVAPPVTSRADSVKAVAPEAVRGAAAKTGARMIPTAGVFVGGRISKIFAAMPAKEAARILEQMVDADVVQILGSVNDRKAAEILSLLPAPRAAGISKSVLARGPIGQ
jgi:cytoskeletal protein RodZ